MGSASSSSDLFDFPRAHAKTEGSLPTMSTAIAKWDHVELRDFAQHERPATERILLPMLKALPSSGGHFSRTAVFYVLHRVLLKRHGWFLKGLEPEGKAWNSTSLRHIVILAKLPTDLQQILEQQLHGPGLRANDVMTLVLLTEYLVHQRTLGQLPIIYKAMGFNMSGSSPLGQVADAVETLFACFIAGLDSVNLTRVQLYRIRTRVHKVYPNWPRLRTFIHETMQQSLQSGSMSILAYHMRRRTPQLIRSASLCIPRTTPEMAKTVQDDAESATASSVNAAQQQSSPALGSMPWPWMDMLQVGAPWSEKRSLDTEGGPGR